MQLFFLLYLRCWVNLETYLRHRCALKWKFKGKTHKLKIVSMFVFICATVSFYFVVVDWGPKETQTTCSQTEKKKKCRKMLWKIPKISFLLLITNCRTFLFLVFIACWKDFFKVFLTVLPSFTRKASRTLWLFSIRNEAPCDRFWQFY